MRILITIALTLIACQPVLAWNDYTDEWNEEIRQADEENYRNRMLAIQEDLLMIETIREQEKIRQRHEHAK